MLWGALVSPLAADTIYGRVFDTLDNGKIFTDVKLTLFSNPPQQTTVDQYGQYWFKNVKRGAYLIGVQILDREKFTARVVVDNPTTIANLDLGKIGDPDHGY